MRLRLGLVLLLGAFALAGCGGSPLESLGLRSSDWINEPTVPTTVAVVTTIPTIVSSETLLWANDEIETESLDDVGSVLQEIFARRQGDRFIQASRFEIAVALEGVAFPDMAPAGAEWVSSQLVFDNDGTVSDDPSAAFGIWSAEPYSRSRSVAQMVVLKLATDTETANQLATGEVAPTCALFSDRTAENCEVVTVGSRDTWILSSASGSTVIWFDGPYRYELFGRSFVPIGILRQMSDQMVPLTSIEAESS
jgi:hypothetical protein